MPALYITMIPLKTPCKFAYKLKDFSYKNFGIYSVFMINHC